MKIVLDWFCGCPYSAEIASNMAWAEREIRKQEKQMSFNYSTASTEELLDYRRRIINEKGEKRKVVEALYNDLVADLVQQENNIMAEIRSRYPSL